VRPADVFRLGFAALARQKVRTALTTVGVVVGTVVLFLSLSIGQGLRETILKAFRKYDALRTVYVYPSYDKPPKRIPEEKLKIEGQMSDARRARLRQARERELEWAYRGPFRPLTSQSLAEMSAIEHVSSAIPRLEMKLEVFYAGRWHTVSADAVPVVGPGDEPIDAGLRRRVVEGTYFDAANQRALLVSEYTLYRWGVTDEEDVGEVLSREVRLRILPGRQEPSSLLSLLGVKRTVLEEGDKEVMRKVLARLPQALDGLELTDEERATLKRILEGRSAWGKEGPPDLRPREVPGTFTVVGVARDHEKEDLDIGSFNYITRGDVYLPLQTAQEIHARLPPDPFGSFHTLLVRVDREENVRQVHEAIKAKGYRAQSFVELVDQVQLNVLLITFATAFVAVVALVVSALGITNTLLMSVLERTHEIGVMKAVGARDGHVLALFVIEGAVLGLAGSLLGLLLGWLASLPGDAIVHSMVEVQIDQPFTESVFAFPWWLVLGVPVFVTLLTTAAAVYPARRAARVNPVVALRHE
jgi:putative ABC transport system permease protein